VRAQPAVLGYTTLAAPQTHTRTAYGRGGAVRTMTTHACCRAHCAVPAWPAPCLPGGCHSYPAAGPSQAFQRWSTVRWVMPAAAVGRLAASLRLTRVSRSPLCRRYTSTSPRPCPCGTPRRPGTRSRRGSWQTRRRRLHRRTACSCRTPARTARTWRRAGPARRSCAGAGRGGAGRGRGQGGGRLLRCCPRAWDGQSSAQGRHDGRVGC
jgi:hypothetical protein